MQGMWQLLRSPFGETPLIMDGSCHSSRQALSKQSPQIQIGMICHDMICNTWYVTLVTGMFVWGGGPVVLPMLMTFLTPQWISPTIFLAGISFAEMMPGPVFNISCNLKEFEETVQQSCSSKIVPHQSLAMPKRCLKDDSECN